MDHQARSARPTGLDLKLQRVAAGVSQRELAGRMGVSPQRLAAVEASFRPSRAMASRFDAALGQDPSLDGGPSKARTPLRKSARPTHEGAPGRKRRKARRR